MSWSEREQNRKIRQKQEWLKELKETKQRAEERKEAERKKEIELDLRLEAKIQHDLVDLQKSWIEEKEHLQ